MKKWFFIFLLIFGLVGCDEPPTANQIEAYKQERQLQEMAKQLGMPAITNFREKKILKMVLEMRDQNIITYTYTHSDYNGKFRFVGNSVGFPISASTQYTSPQKIEHPYAGHYVVMPQADPNGLFSPSSAEGSYLLMQDPATKELKACYFETRINTLPFKLPPSVVIE